MVGHISTMRLYGSAIALVSGLYSVLMGVNGQMTNAGIMVVVGVIVLVHGVILLTSLSEKLGAASGPLMIVYAAIMLANEAWRSTIGGQMRDGMMDGGMGNTAVAAGLGWDPGMASLAVLMLISGIIMASRHEMMT